MQNTNQQFPACHQSTQESQESKETNGKCIFRNYPCNSTQISIKSKPIRKTTDGLIRPYVSSYSKNIVICNLEQERRFMKASNQKKPYKKQYLQGTKQEIALKNLRARTMTHVKRVAPRDEDFELNLQFDEKIQRSGQMLVISPTSSFTKSNDISNPNFNPVIHKIESFMAKKDKKTEQGHIAQQSQKLSFLSIRNLWANAQHSSNASSILFPLQNAEYDGRTNNNSNAVPNMMQMNPINEEQQSHLAARVGQFNNNVSPHFIQDQQNNVIAQINNQPNEMTQPNSQDLTHQSADEDQEMPNSDSYRAASTAHGDHQINSHHYSF